MSNTDNGIIVEMQPPVFVLDGVVSEDRVAKLIANHEEELLRAERDLATYTAECEKLRYRIGLFSYTLKILKSTVVEESHDIDKTVDKKE